MFGGKFSAEIAHRQVVLFGHALERGQDDQAEDVADCLGSQHDAAFRFVHPVSGCSATCRKTSAIRPGDLLILAAAETQR